ncbi:transposon ty3-G gag-pol polyprotein [Tanacetum coccineum]|uniref:Transposon ty3-G gag-pol polyprotein n=1 Tax=Tanacetum coccineum TaxID=301880 RepID=A0ABQ5BDY1_9ASTR
MGFKGGPIVVTGSEVKPYLKLHFPRYSGDDPMGWIYQAEQYFDFQKALLTWFGPTDYDDASEALHRLKQVTTVAAYQESFERLLNRVDGLPESFLVGCFIGGLKEEIRLEVKFKNPRQLVNATPGLLGPAPAQPLALPSPTAVRRLSNNEARGRREKGLCYYCDERYTPGHKCSKPQLFMISETQEVKEEHHEESVVQKTNETPAEILFHAISGNHEKLVCTGWVKDLTIVIQACSSHKLQGLKGSDLTALKSHECMGLNGTAMLPQISPIFDNPLPDHTPCPAIQSVLFEFVDVFHEPNGLPPSLFQDHNITLLPGSRPVSSRPY